MPEEHIPPLAAVLREMTAVSDVRTTLPPEFVVAVKDALPYMRFSPAKIGRMKVKQLVQQQFSFKINDTAVVAPKKKP